MAKYNVGDELAFYYSDHGGYYVIRKIDRITPSGRYVVGHATLNPDLTIRGAKEMWSHAPRSAEPVTDEIRASVRRRNLLARLRKVNWAEHDDETLIEVYKLVTNSTGK